MTRVRHLPHPHIEGRTACGRPVRIGMVMDGEMRVCEQCGQKLDAAKRREHNREFPKGEVEEARKRWLEYTEDYELLAERAIQAMDNAGFRINDEHIGRGVDAPRALRCPTELIKRIMVASFMLDAAAAALRDVCKGNDAWWVWNTGDGFMGKMGRSEDAKKWRKEREQRTAGCQIANAAGDELKAIAGREAAGYFLAWPH